MAGKSSLKKENSQSEINQSAAQRPDLMAGKFNPPGSENQLTPRFSRLPAQEATILQSSRIILQRKEKTGIQSSFLKNNPTPVLQRKKVVQREGDDEKEKPKGKGKDSASLSATAMKQGGTLGFAESTAASTAQVFDKGLLPSHHPPSAFTTAGDAAKGASIVGDLGGMVGGGLQIHSGATGEHMTTGERAKEIVTGSVSTTANAAKTGLDAMQIVTHATALAPPAAFLGAAAGGAEMVKGGIDYGTARRMDTTLQNTSGGTRTAMGPAFGTLEQSVGEKRTEGGVSGLVGGGKLATGILLASLGLAHVGPIGMAISAALLGALGIYSLGRFGKQRYDQRALGKEIVAGKYDELAQRQQNWQIQAMAIDRMLEEKRVHLGFLRSGLEGILHKERILEISQDPDLQDVTARRTQLEAQIREAEIDFSEVYNARANLYGAKPEIGHRYDKARIEGHWRGYGDVYREELSEKAEEAARILHDLIQSVWKYQRGYLKFRIRMQDARLNSGRLTPEERIIIQRRLIALRWELTNGTGEFSNGPRDGVARNMLDAEILQIIHNLGVKYDRSRNRPTVGDLHKVINKNISTYSKG